MSRFVDALIVVGCLSAFALSGFTLVRPGGPAAARAAAWRKEREVSKTVNQNWATLANSTARLDRGDGTVTIVEFSDYECPFCAVAHKDLKPILTDNPDIGIVYRHLPLTNIHPAAEGAARAAICAEAQDKFQAMHARLFETEEWKKDQNWKREAEAIALPDLATFESCLTSETTNARLREDLRLARVLGLDGTPSFVSRNGVHTGTLSATIARKLAAD